MKYKREIMGCLRNLKSLTDKELEELIYIDVAEMTKEDMRLLQKSDTIINRLYQLEKAYEMYDKELVKYDNA